METQITIESLLAKNKPLKNLHVGERCFILGNGPSLKQVDLSLLADEFVFTVNNFSFVEGYEKAKTNVHLWMDLAFFDVSNAVKFNMDKILSNYHRIAGQNPICFADIRGFNFIKKNKLDEILDMHYLYIGSDISRNEPVSIDIGGQITGLYTVVQYAIDVAIYMGFKEIYLLGCDSTGILDTINTALNIPITNDHAYHDEDSENNQKQLIKNLGMTPCFFQAYALLLGYDKLNYICHNILKVRLINCTSKTIITSIPRVDLLTVLNNSKTA